MKWLKNIWTFFKRALCMTAISFKPFPKKKEDPANIDFQSVKFVFVANNKSGKPMIAFGINNEGDIIFAEGWDDKLEPLLRGHIDLQFSIPELSVRLERGSQAESDLAEIRKFFKKFV
jgi:hypothetical protein